MDPGMLVPLLAGTYAGLNSALIGQPFDVIKTRLQLQSETGRAPLVRVVTETLRERTLFRGATPSVVSAVLENATVFGVNGLVKWAYAKPTPLTLTETAVIGGLSGIFSATAICPAETIKVRMQACPASWSSATACLVQSVRDDGVRSLFRGLPAQMARDVPFNFAFFGFYEAFSRGLALLRGADRSRLSNVETILAGGLAGAGGWFVTLPADIIKSRTQALRGSHPISTLDVVRRTYRESGLRGFFRGYTAVAVRAFPVNGALFFSYEFAQRQLTRGVGV